MNSRILSLEEMLQESPEDAFVKYALALEYSKENNIEKAAHFFEWLLSENSDYLPTYYQAAYFFAMQQQDEKAEKIFQAGISLAKQKQDRHALAELQNAYQNFLIGEL
jgi:Tfp pilus assembly protein PilF